MRQSEADLMRVRSYIEGAGLNDQDRLPVERELADMLGLTRNRLRGALRKLSEEGLIWRHVGRGTFIGRQRHGTEPRSSMSDLTNPREVMEARLSFEPALARLAAYRATGRHFIAMDRCLEGMGEAGDWNGWGQWDVRLHAAIADAAGNTLMKLMFENVQASLNREIWGRLRERNHAARMKATNRQHEQLVQAIRDRDAVESEALMRQHLESVGRNMFGDI